MSTHGWQPIATAPRDGTAILIGCAKGEKGWGVSVAAWCEEEQGWIVGSGKFWHGPAPWYLVFQGPTHWHPLPESPVAPDLKDLASRGGPGEI